MVVQHPLSYTTIAEEIATSWGRFGGSYILVAPPLTDPDYIFKLLNDTSFQKKCGLNFNKIALASLSPTSYRDSKDFVRRVIEMWEININYDEYDGDELEPLEDALNKLEQQGRTPIILLPQFHKTIDKLHWALGARLREFEVNFGLCTVVELPVPLSRLRERWELLDSKETFICSDFGQGHSMIVVNGYTKCEIKNLAEAANLDDDYTNQISAWSGGMPALVRWLMREAMMSKSSLNLESIARKGSIEQSKRFLNWLDAPNVDFYKHKIASLWQNSSSEENRIAIRAHDWKDILVDKSGLISSSVIGYACANSIGGDSNQKLAAISSAVMTRDLNKVDELINGLPETYRAEDKYKKILITISVWKHTIGFSPDWSCIERTSKQAKKKIGNVNTDLDREVLSAFERWQEFAKGIKYFKRFSEGVNADDLRLTDSLSGKVNGDSLASVQLVLHRLYEAGENNDWHVTFQSVLQIPEQILQIYCGRKLKITVWDSPEFSKEIISKVNNVWPKKSAYRVPKINSRLSFMDLLYFGWVLMSELDKKDRLFEDVSKIQYWQGTYENLRNQPSHSITFESEDSCKDFYGKCVELAENLTRALEDITSEQALPKLDLIIKSIASPDT